MKRAPFLRCPAEIFGRLPLARWITFQRAAYLFSILSLCLILLIIPSGVAVGSAVDELEKIEAKDLQREKDAARTLRTPLFDLAAANDTALRKTSLLDEWRQRGTVEGRDLSQAPGPQVSLQTSETVRIVGAYRYQHVRGLLKPSVYLQPGGFGGGAASGFHKILVVVAPQWPRPWHDELLKDVGERTVLVGFHNPLGEPDFDGIKEFVEAYRNKIWALAPAWSLASNIEVWNEPAPPRLMNPEPAVDVGYRQTVNHLWAVTNFVNRNWPELPVCIFMCENRYTNEAFVQALRYSPSAFLADNGLDYQWGSGKLTPSHLKNSRFRMSSFEAIRKHMADTPIFCLGQSVRLKSSGGAVADADERLARESAAFFEDAAKNGYAGACLGIHPNKKGERR